MKLRDDLKVCMKKQGKEYIKKQDLITCKQIKLIFTDHGNVFEPKRLLVEASWYFAVMQLFSIYNWKTDIIF